MTAATGGTPRVRVVVRYDDFCNGGPDDLDRFLVETAGSSGVPLSIAVVPFGWGPEESWSVGSRYRREEAGDLRADKAAILEPGLLDGYVGLAQHGYDHIPVAEDALGRPSEFLGDSAAQRERIAGGLAILERATGARPGSFVPPWNRFDAATVEATEALGFAVLSAGREAPAGVDRTEATSVSLLPATIPAADLRREILAARAASEDRLIVGLLHPYDFVEVGRPWGRLKRADWSGLMDWVGRQPDVEALKLEEAAVRDGDLGARRLAAYGRYHAAATRRLIPPSWTGSLDRALGWYPKLDRIGRLRRLRALAAAAIWVPALVLAASAGYGLARVADPVSAPGRALSIVLTAAVIPLALRAWSGGGPYFKGLAVTLATLALALGAWLA